MKIGRLAAFVGMLSLLLLATAWWFGGLSPKFQGVMLLSVTAVFTVSEAFLWKAIDTLSQLPQSETLPVADAQEFSGLIQRLKRRLVTRWFVLLFLKLTAGVCSVWLMNQDKPGGEQLRFWLVGVAALLIGVPIVLSFFWIWQQADEIKARQLLAARQKKETADALKELSAQPASPLNADAALKGYNQVVETTEQPGAGG
jgi:hypothetical protein